MSLSSIFSQWFLVWNPLDGGSRKEEIRPHCLRIREEKITQEINVHKSLANLIYSVTETTQRYNLAENRVKYRETNISEVVYVLCKLVLY